MLSRLGYAISRTYEDYEDAILRVASGYAKKVIKGALDDVYASVHHSNGGAHSRGDYLTLRKNQVYDETQAPLPTKGRFVARYCIQEHDALRAGKHWDLRILINGKARSWAIPKHRLGNKLLAVKQPDHTETYMNFEGSIPKGQYGAGTVKIVKEGLLEVHHCDAEKISFSFYDTPQFVKFTLVNTKGDNWIMMRSGPPDFGHIERPPYRKHNKLFVFDPEQHFVDKKIDGAHYFMIPKPYGNHFISKNVSVGGELIDRSANVPHLRDIVLPKEFHGKVIHVELFHDRGHSFLGGILNSGPFKARETQATSGLVKCAFLELRSEGPWIERRELLEELTKMDRNFIVPQRMKYADAVKAMDGTPGDVACIHDMHAEYGQPITKMKGHESYDVKVIGFTEGEGRNEGSLGALLIGDRNNKPMGKVGGGFSDTDRTKIFSNKSSYLSRVAEVRGEGLTNSGSIRAPVFDRWRWDKPASAAMSVDLEAALRDRIAGMGLPSTVLYAFKSSRGWRRAV